MGKWKRLTTIWITSALLGLLSACGQQSLDASGSSPIKNEQAAMQTEEWAPDGESDASGPSAAALETVAPLETSEEAGSPDALQTDQAEPATAVPTDVKPGASVPNGNGSADASSSATAGASSSATPGSVPSQAPTASDSAVSTDVESHTATLSITGNAEWGTVLDATEVELNKDDTVRDILIRTLKSHKLAFETRGAGALFYVTGIDGLFEFDDGPLSGWKYRVNGEVVGTSAGVYQLESGDRVEWFYTTDGNDD